MLAAVKKYAALSGVHNHLADSFGGTWSEQGLMGISTLHLPNHDVHLGLSEDPSSVVLENIIVDGQRGQGIGSDVLEALHGYADTTGKDLYSSMKSRIRLSSASSIGSL